MECMVASWCGEVVEKGWGGGGGGGCLTGKVWHRLLEWFPFQEFGCSRQRSISTIILVKLSLTTSEFLIP